MCQVLLVSRSGYYKWLKVKDEYQEKEAILDEQIKSVFESSRKNYGSPRGHLELKKLDQGSIFEIRFPINIVTKEDFELTHFGAN